MNRKRASQVTVREVTTAMDEIAPPAAAQEWDNVGLQAGTLTAPVQRVLLAIDLHAIGSSDQVGRLHAFNKAVTDCIRDFDEDVTLNIRVYELPERRAFLAGQRLE